MQEKRRKKNEGINKDMKFGKREREKMVRRNARKIQENEETKKNV